MRIQSLVTLLGLTVVGCTVHSDKTPAPPPPAEAMAAEWAWLQRVEAELTDKRKRLKRLDGTPEAAALLEEVIRLGDDFGARLVVFINGQKIRVGDELTPRQREAFDMKAAEDIYAAQGYIDKGGDYGRAIDIYTHSLVVDPSNEALLAARARAEELRYMSRERLALVKKGMTEPEVRERLGTPRPVNVREFDNGIVAWYYPKKEPRTAAGVFRHNGRELVVYKADFNAIEAVLNP